MEEQFYLMFPLLLQCARKQCSSVAASASRCRAVWCAAVCAVAAALSLLSALVLSAAGESNFAFYLLPPRAWQLGAGTALCVLDERSRDKPPRASWHTRTLEVAGLVGIALSFALPHFPPFAQRNALLGTGGAVALIAAGRDADGAVSGARGLPLSISLLATRPVVYIGRLSYPLYLWHWPTFVLMRWCGVFRTAAFKLAGGVVALTLAAATHHAVERPLARVRRKGRLTRLLVAAGMAVGALLLAIRGPLLGALYVGEGGMWRGQWGVPAEPFNCTCPPGERFRERYDADPLSRCYSHSAFTSFEATVWARRFESAAPSRLYLFGDSHANHLAAGLLAAFGRTHRLVNIACLGVPFHPSGLADNPMFDPPRARTWDRWTEAFAEDRLHKWPSLKDPAGPLLVPTTDEASGAGSLLARLRQWAGLAPASSAHYCPHYATNATAKLAASALRANDVVAVAGSYSRAWCVTAGGARTAWITNHLEQLRKLHALVASRHATLVLLGDVPVGDAPPRPTNANSTHWTWSDASAPLGAWRAEIGPCHDALAEFARELGKHAVFINVMDALCEGGADRSACPTKTIPHTSRALRADNNHISKEASFTLWPRLCQGARAALKPPLPVEQNHTARGSEDWLWRGFGVYGMDV